MTNDELQNLIKKTFEDGQISGIELACDSLISSLQHFKSAMQKMVRKEESA
jgi:hypothetical protein